MNANSTCDLEVSGFHPHGHRKGKLETKRKAGYNHFSQAFTQTRQIYLKISTVLTHSQMFGNFLG